jgi:hypothetical protein
MFELHRSEGGEESVIVVDLEKVCVVRVTTQAGHHYPEISIRFVDGYEAHDIVPPDAARRFLDALREHLTAPP